MKAIIEEWRRRIDQLDSQIVALLNERAEHAIRVGREKQKKHQSIHSPEREAEVLQRAFAANQGPLDEQAIERIFRAIIEESRRLQERQMGG